MPKRPCARPGCPALVLRGYCDAHQQCSSRAVAQAVRVKPPWQHWYNSARWLAARAGYFAKHPFCADPFKVHGEVLVIAKHLDHIVPHLGDIVLFWLRSNWQGLCHSCHSRKTATEDGGFGRPRPTDTRK